MVQICDETMEFNHGLLMKTTFIYQQMTQTNYHQSHFKATKANLTPDTSFCLSANLI